MVYGSANFSVARQRLVNGVANIIKTQSEQGETRYYPLSVKALKRVFEINKVFTLVCKNKSCISEQDRRASRMISLYLEFVATDVTRLDENFYISARSCRDYRSYCNYGRTWWLNFATEYKNLALKTLGLLNGSYSPIPNSGMPEVLTYDIYELRLSSMFFKWAASDLSRDDMRRFFRHDISDLRAHAIYIDDNISRPRMFPSLVKETRAVSKQIENILNRGDYCDYSDSARNWFYKY